MTESPFGVVEIAPDQRILRSIIVPLASAIFGLLLAMVLGLYGLIEAEDRAQVEKIVKAAGNLLHVQLEEEEETLKVGLAGILGNPAFAAPLRAGDRAELLRLAKPIYGSIRPEAQVSHFYFIAADGTVTLRVHAPDYFGDPFIRGLTAKAARTGKDESGLELGKLGSLAMRASAPYRDKGDIIGFVQQAVEFEHIADTLHQVLGVDLVTVIDKQQLIHEEWEAGRPLFHWPLPWNRLPAVVINDSTLPTLPDQVLQRIAAAPADGGVTPGYVLDNGRILYLAPLPLLDEAGHRLGSLLVVADRTSLITSSRLFMGVIALLSLCLAVALVVLFHRIIAKVERKIGDGIAGLARTTADLERVAFMACHELQAPLDQLMTASLELERNAGQLDADNARHLQRVADGARRLEQTVGTLEDYLDLDINARPMEAVDLDAVLAAALEKVQPLLGEGQVTVTPLPKVAGRPILLARAVLCILDYALKARPPGHALPLTVWAEGQNGNWRIWFAGLPQNPDGVAPPPEKGSPWAIARRIAQLHGGDLTITSVPHHGAAILLTLCPATVPPSSVSSYTMSR